MAENPFSSEERSRNLQVRMDSATESLSSRIAATSQRISPTMATNHPVTFRSVSVVEGGGNVTAAATTEINGEISGMNTGTEMTLNDSIGRPNAIPAEDGDVARPSAPLSSPVAAKTGTETVTPRENEPAERGNGKDGQRVDKVENNCDDEEESDYSYDYEEEDETDYSGFLIPTEPFETGIAAGRASASRRAESASSAETRKQVNVVAASENDENSDLGQPRPVGSSGVGRTSNDSSVDTSETVQASASAETASAVPLSSCPQGHERKKKWKEPTQAAVSMSLRAEKEKTGGRRRLASDLYRIMTADTKEAGFSLEPCDEDSMDKWSIKLFGFDEDSNLAKDLLVLGMDYIELEMVFPDQYPFEPPFVRVVRPRFKRQTGFVMNGALCMELLTKDGWNPINDIESVIVSIRSLMVVGDGRLQAAVDLGRKKYSAVLDAALESKKEGKVDLSFQVSQEGEDDESEADDETPTVSKRKRSQLDDSTEDQSTDRKKINAGSYTAAEASAAYTHLSDYHKSKGWDRSGWWAKKG